MYPIKLCNKANYGSKRKLDIKYIVIHYTSNNGDTALNNVTYFARETLQNPASANYFVDEKEIWISVPDDFIAYHCGGKTYKHKICRNSNSLGIEICMNDKKGNIRYDSIKNAIELTKILMKKYNIPISNVLRHYDITGKNCPAPMVENPKLWQEFLNSLTQNPQTEEIDDDMKIYKKIDEMPDWAKASVKKAIDKKIISTDKNGAVTVFEPNLQSLVWMDRAGLFDKK